MTVTGKESYKEVVQIALRAEKLAIENRRIRAEFAKMRNSNISSGQPSKKHKDLSTSRSTIACGQQGHIRMACPQLVRATIAVSSPSVRIDTQRRDFSGSQSRQGVVIQSDVGNRSYVSKTLAYFSDRNLSPLEEEIVVHTSLGEQLIRNTYCRDCGIRGVEVVFARERRVLPSCVISAIKTLKLVRKGYPAHLAHVIDTSKREPKLEDVPIVNKFLDVFPNELPRLPPDRELEFSIDLLPGTAPIFIPPYRMAPVELKELKV
ncbi:PREDICTED: uncharacterized protein LOC108661943 [Theobroma cacao]|uniref:Uncharacterized protein LOC108661943 n=1 Tax=Theobroma cacao TaxID=3641 RepID=A0AB32W948_THECC|nr:PREDICTED: uncharacterized protein LOC108661943 [Theobroma cacao]